MNEQNLKKFATDEMIDILMCHFLQEGEDVGKAMILAALGTKAIDNDEGGIVALTQLKGDAPNSFRAAIKTWTEVARVAYGKLLPIKPGKKARLTEKDFVVWADIHSRLEGFSFDIGQEGRGSPIGFNEACRGVEEDSEPWSRRDKTRGKKPQNHITKKQAQAAYNRVEEHLTFTNTGKEYFLILQHFTGRILRAEHATKI